MGYYSELSIDTRTIGQADEDARLDRADGYTRIDPTIADAQQYRKVVYSIYYSTGRSDWRKQHAGSFPSYKLALKALKRLGWQQGNGVYHCIIPATANVLTQAIGLELLYNSH